MNIADLLIEVTLFKFFIFLNRGLVTMVNGGQIAV